MKKFFQSYFGVCRDLDIFVFVAFASSFKLYIDQCFVSNVDTSLFLHPSLLGLSLHVALCTDVFVQEYVDRLQAG